MLPFPVGALAAPGPAEQDHRAEKLDQLWNRVIHALQNLLLRCRPSNLPLSIGSGIRALEALRSSRVDFPGEVTVDSSSYSTAVHPARDGPRAEELFYGGH